MLQNYKWTKRLIIATPILVFVAIFFMGGGHGTYKPAMFLFPWGMINTMWQDRLSEPLAILGILQFPIYGLLIDISDFANKKSLILSLIIVFHIILAIVILIFNVENWK